MKAAHSVLLSDLSSQVFYSCPLHDTTECPLYHDPRALQLYHTQFLHQSGHPATAALLADTIKGTFCTVIVSKVKSWYSPVEMWWHTVTKGRGSEGETGEWSGYSQYSPHYLGTWCIQHYYRWWAHLGCQYSTELTPPWADLNGLVRFARKTKSGFCACAITFQKRYTDVGCFVWAVYFGRRNVNFFVTQLWWREIKLFCNIRHCFEFLFYYILYVIWTETLVYRNDIC